MVTTERVYEIGKCTFDVHSDGSATIKCGDGDVTLSRTELKLLEGASDIAVKQ